MQIYAQKISYLLLACATLLAFGATLTNGFALDDLIHIVDNGEIRSINLLSIFTHPIFPGNLFRPALILSYALTFKLFGLNPLAYHLLNLLLHCAVVFLVFTLLRRYCDSKLAFLSSLLFAVHPLHTETVANVSGRAELMAACFGLLSLCLTIKPGKFTAASLALLAALFCKESALVIIPLSILLQYYSITPARVIIKSTLLNLAAAAIYFSVRYIALAGHFIGGSSIELIDNPLVTLSFTERIFNALFLLARYIALIVFPYPLSADYSFAQTAVLDFNQDNLALFIVSLVVLLFAFAVNGVIKRRNYGLSLAWFFIAFAVTANVLIPIGTIFAERLAYLPSLGIIITLLLALERLRLLQMVYVILPLAISYSAWHLQVWKDNTTLHSYQIQVSPQSAKTQLNYAMVLKGQGDLDQAHYFARQAFDIYPNYDDAAWVIGNIYANKGVLVGAEHWYKRALKINSDHVRSLDDLARLSINRKRFEQAEKYIARLRQTWPKRAETEIVNLVLLYNQGKVEESRSLLQSMLKRYPDNSELRKIDQQIKAHAK